MQKETKVRPKYMGKCKFCPDDKDRASVMQYFQRQDRHRAVKFLIEMIEDHSLYAEFDEVMSVG